MFQEAKHERMTHNYTSEIELKVLLIRVKNKKMKTSMSVKDNTKIDKYIKWYNLLGNKKYSSAEKKIRVRTKLKDTAIRLAEKTMIDELTYERFGNVILLMIKNILRKPNFSGYSYKDDFYSDAIGKILKYLHNFDHTKISERSGISVNAFAYISQIIHNSIVHIINKKNKEIDNLKHYISTSENGNGNINLDNCHLTKRSTYTELLEQNMIKQKDIVIENITTLFEELQSRQEEFQNIEEGTHIVIHYPHNYSISFEEYADIQPLLKNISIIRLSK